MASDVSSFLPFGDVVFGSHRTNQPSLMAFFHCVAGNDRVAVVCVLEVEPTAPFRIFSDLAGFYPSL